MPSRHTVIALGHLGKDPEMRYTPTGTAITSFSMPLTKGFGDNEKTSWAQISCFGKTAEYVANNGKKGMLAHVTGQIYLDEWEGKDGDKRTSLKMDAQSVDLIKPRATE